MDQSLCEVAATFCPGAIGERKLLPWKWWEVGSWSWKAQNPNKSLKTTRNFESRTDHMQVQITMPGWGRLAAEPRTPYL